MTKKGEIYRCAVCGNLAEVVGAGSGKLVCCGQPMTLMAENTEEASWEKHIPVVERLEDRIRVRVGSAPHPMEDVHFIEWIEWAGPNRTDRVYLRPGDAPEAEFPISEKEKRENGIVRAYCNLHGLWKNEAVK